MLKLEDASIAGQLDLAGAQLGTGRTGTSLAAANLQVDGDALLNREFTAAGVVCLRAAHIAGQLDLAGAKLGTGQTGRTGTSLAAANLQVDGDAFLNEGFTAAGGVRLTGANITGGLSLRRAKLGTDSTGISLSAENLQVDGNAFLDEGFTAAGGVRLVRAHIIGGLSLRRAKLGTDSTGAGSGE